VCHAGNIELFFDENDINVATREKIGFTYDSVGIAVSILASKSFMSCTYCEFVISVFGNG